MMENHFTSKGKDISIDGRGLFSDDIKQSMKKTRYIHIISSKTRRIKILRLHVPDRFNPNDEANAAKTRHKNSCFNQLFDRSSYLIFIKRIVYSKGVK